MESISFPSLPQQTPSSTIRLLSLKAIRRQVRSVGNAELWDHERFVNLKIAHIDSIGFVINIGSSHTDSNHSKNQRNKPGKKDKPCNNWNDNKCSQINEECRRQHVWESRSERERVQTTYKVKSLYPNA
jgi:hypothetical protein